MTIEKRKEKAIRKAMLKILEHKDDPLAHFEHYPQILADLWDEGFYCISGFDRAIGEALQCLKSL